MKNVAALVQRQLVQISKEHRADPNHVFLQYALERLLYRLSMSDHADRLILKGAMLFAAWTGVAHRATRDVDFLTLGNPSPDRFARYLNDLCSLPVEDDGVTFHSESIEVTVTGEQRNYTGLHACLDARLSTAKVRLHIDVGFGDVVTPGVERIEYPVLLGFPVPRIQAYPKESVVAEKLHAMVVLGLANSRMKDFYDVLVILRLFELDQRSLAAAIDNTFRRRRTVWPAGVPYPLTDSFSMDSGKRRQWTAFAKKNEIVAMPEDFSEVVRELRERLRWCFSSDPPSS